MIGVVAMMLRKVKGRKKEGGGGGGCVRVDFARSRFYLPLLVTHFSEVKKKKEKKIEKEKEYTALLLTNGCTFT